MEADGVESGTVFTWPHDDRPNRVLIRDTDVVMYDAWWPHLENWGLADLRQTRRQRVAYYVTTITGLLGKAEYLRTEPLTDDEAALHRPDLPFAPIQSAAMAWSADGPEPAADATGRPGAVERPASPAGVALNIPEVYLYPFGPNGGQKAGVRVKAAGQGFTFTELLEEAAAAQAPWIKNPVPTQGIGIYRSGLHRGIPAYYLWGSRSRLLP